VLVFVPDPALVPPTRNVRVGEVAKYVIFDTWLKE
jgi:hypothetical protein